MFTRQVPNGTSRNAPRGRPQLVPRSVAVAVKKRDPVNVAESADKNTNPSILVLPNEVLLVIGQFMDENSLAAMIQTSRFMRDLLIRDLYIRAIDFVPRDHPSVIEWAAETGQLETINKVLEQMPADNNLYKVVASGIAAAICGDQVPALQYLCRVSFSPISKYILPDNTASAVDLSGNPVNLAAHSGSPHVLQFLLESGVSFATPPIRTAALMFEGRGRLTGDTRVAELLIRYGFNVRVTGITDQNYTLLHDLAIRGGAAHVDLLAATVPEHLNQQDRHGRTPLMHAIAAGQNECARHMVTVTGADVSLRNMTGATALHIAVRGGNIELVEALISRGADVNAPDSGQLTPLHMATDITTGPIREPLMVAILLNAGAFCSPRDRSGNTPLRNALGARTIRIVNWLLVAGAQYQDYEFENIAVLLDACRVGSMEIVRVFAGREGFDIERWHDQWKRGALHLAATGAQTEVVTYLLQTWTKIDRRDAAGRTALWYAARKVDHRCASELIHAGASIDAPDDFNWTPLMNFSRHVQSEQAMTCFLKLSKNVEWVDRKNRNVLHHAARNGNLHATRAIFEFRPDLLSTRDSQQQSALLIALTYGRTEVVEFLKGLIYLSERDFEWLRSKGFTSVVTAIRNGPEWAETRRLWIAGVEEDRMSGLTGDEREDEDEEEEEEEEL